MKFAVILSLLIGFSFTAQAENEGYIGSYKVAQQCVNRVKSGLNGSRCLKSVDYIGEAAKCVAYCEQRQNHFGHCLKFSKVDVCGRNIVCVPVCLDRDYFGNCLKFRAGDACQTEQRPINVIVGNGK